MDDENTSTGSDLYLVSEIVSSYVKHNSIAANDLPTVIATVHQALSGLGKPALPAEPLTPAVPVRQSIRPDYVVCLECGLRGKMLRRHLALQHGLEPAAYYARWQLPPDHPITAPGYSARRSAMAKELGFGRRRKATSAALPEPEAFSPIKPRRRRSRSSAEAQAAPST
jgi:predicted transcriptional regulator